jgi:hypothetical protein
MALLAIGSYRALECYLHTEGMEAGVVVTRALLLGNHHCLTADVVLAKGGGPLSLDQRRKLVASCLKHGATPPFSQVGPSRLSIDRRSDQRGERRACSLEMLGMRLLDYVLVGPSQIRRVRWYQSCVFRAGVVAILSSEGSIRRRPRWLPRVAC